MDTQESRTGKPRIYFRRRGSQSRRTCMMDEISRSQGVTLMRTHRSRARRKGDEEAFLLKWNYIEYRDITRSEHVAKHPKMCLL